MAQMLERTEKTPRCAQSDQQGRHRACAWPAAHDSFATTGGWKPEAENHKASDPYLTPKHKNKRTS